MKFFGPDFLRATQKAFLNLKIISKNPPVGEKLIRELRYKTREFLVSSFIYNLNSKYGIK